MPTVAYKSLPMDHQGIDDAIVGKASVVVYLYRGKWLHLSGAGLNSPIG